MVFLDCSSDGVERGFWEYLVGRLDFLVKSVYFWPFSVENSGFQVKNGHF